jgi:3-hydroxybutyryl-CoA dehydrogenase
MQFVVLANDEQWEILKNTIQEVEWKRVGNIEHFLNTKNAAAYFNLQINSADEDYTSITAPIFINSTIKTLASIHANSNIVRLNAWHGFLEKDLWEIAGEISLAKKIILQRINKKYIVVSDVPGFVSARTIAMIINEAYSAKGDNVSSETDIDIAMKLGTNYPYGPFEWAKKIGLKNVYALLQKLAATDERYTISPALEEANKNET